MKCIHQPNRLSVIPSELAPLLDVVPVGVEVQADEVLNQPRCAHALSSEEADNPVKFVTHLLADEHGLAVDNLGDLEIGGAVFLQRQPALLAADTLLWQYRFLGHHTCRFIRHSGLRFFHDGLAGLFRLIRLQTDTPVDVVHRLGSVGLPASHLFHDFTSLLLCNVWFSLHCKKQID